MQRIYPALRAHALGSLGAAIRFALLKAATLDVATVAARGASCTGRERDTQRKRERDTEREQRECVILRLVIVFRLVVGYSQFLLPKGDLSAPPPELPNRFGDAQLRPLHRFGQHLPPIALHSLSCRHFGVQFVTLVDEGQSAEE